MQIVRAGLVDIGDAAPLFAAYREFYGAELDLEAARTFLTSRVARDESVVLLARDDDGATVGFAEVYPTFSSTALAPVWVLNDLFVTERARGSGAVDALLEAVADQARAAGAAAVELSTAHDNLRAQAVYDRHGYVLDEVYRQYAKPLDRPV